MGEGEIQNVSTISPQHHTLEAPELLKNLQSWLIWRYEENPGKSKPRKVPYWADGTRRYLQQGSDEDRARLVTFAAAQSAAIRKGFDGVGFALMPEYGITALDFDGVVGPNGEIPSEVLQIVGRTYAEFSPSGKGIRAFVKGNLGDHTARQTETEYGFETYNTNRYVTFTGNVLPICQLTGTDEVIADVDDRVIKLCEHRFGSAKPREKSDDPFAGHEPRLGLSPEEIEETLDKLDPGMTRDDWIRVGMAVHHECEGDDTGLALWNEWSMTAHNYVSFEDLEAQWNGFTRRAATGPQVTMRSVLKMVKQAVGVDALKAVSESGAALADPDTGVRTPDDYAGKFKVHSATDLLARPPLEWYIKGILPKAAIIAVYGASGAGKSFAVLNMLGAITRGLEWRGRKVRKARAVYVAAEGQGGFGKRLEAYARQQNITVAELEQGLGVITDAPNLLDKEDVEELVKAVAAAGGAEIITRDTLAQVTPGANENTSEDMGRALANAKAIHDATGATVIFVGHSGKDAARGLRGWSGIKGALDAEIEISREEDGYREIHVDKMRDGEDGLKFGFRLEVVDLGIDADGDPVTSCVIEEIDPKDRSVDPGERDAKAIQRLGAVERLIVDTIEERYPSDDSVRYDELVASCVERMGEPEAGQRDTRRARVVRAVKNLAGKNGQLEISNGRINFLL